MKTVNTNVYSDNNKSTMESRNCILRIARHDDTEFSNQSIMNVMEKFVKAVNDMDETILVPCRLMDLKVGDAGDTVDMTPSLKVPKGSGKRSVRDMTSSDLYNLYTMVNSVKNELLWGQNTGSEEPSSEISSSSVAPKGHVRRPSTASMTSTNSAASISDTDSDTGNENDSGIEAEYPSQTDYSQQVSENFRRHLHGLYRSLEQMTEAATYLTTRYQNDIGGAV